ncbi:NADH-quinone oxidoreductase subunit A [Anaplasma bovis]|uniref:NADH-quinone oxidoreductase subunit A n=1 Tax=Anaplasma bovis TaxID=186733 RepID=UPI002FF00AB7
MEEYSSILLFCSLAVIISSAFAILPMFLARRKDTWEKVLPYECGFDQRVEPGSVFDVKFCVVGILFVIFDIEVAFLLPWAVTLREVGAMGYWSMMAFMFVLTVGFLYEWKSGALEWE